MLSKVCLSYLDWYDAGSKSRLCSNIKKFKQMKWPLKVVMVKIKRMT